MKHSLRAAKLLQASDEMIWSQLGCIYTRCIGYRPSLSTKKDRLISLVLMNVASLYFYLTVFPHLTWCCSSCNILMPWKSGIEDSIVRRLLRLIILYYGVRHMGDVSSKLARQILCHFRLSTITIYIFIIFLRNA